MSILHRYLVRKPPYSEYQKGYQTVYIKNVTHLTLNDEKAHTLNTHPPPGESSSSSRRAPGDLYPAVSFHPKQEAYQQEAPAHRQLIFALTSAAPFVAPEAPPTRAKTHGRPRGSPPHTEAPPPFPLDAPPPLRYPIDGCVKGFCSTGLKELIVC